MKLSPLAKKCHSLASFLNVFYLKKKKELAKNYNTFIHKVQETCI